jgi:torulene dioxygenase
MFFHLVNGYNYICPRTGLTNIYINLCSYNSDYILYWEYTLSNTINPARPFKDGTLVRYELAGINDELNKHERKATIAQAFHDFPMELPCINKSYSTVPSYWYVYAIGGNGGQSPSTLVLISWLGKNLKCVQGVFFN